MLPAETDKFLPSAEKKCRKVLVGVLSRQRVNLMEQHSVTS